MTRILQFIIGCAGFLCIIALDKFYWQTSILAEGWPKVSIGYLIRSALIFISLAAVFLSLIGKKKPEFILFEKGDRLKRISISGTLFISIIFLLVFIFQPATFSQLSLEMGLLETTQFLLLLASSAIFIFIYLKCYNKKNISKSIKFSLAFFAFIFFIIAMEEVSWFQWIIKYQTSAMFSDNAQKEVNLHNFATNSVKNIYYFGSFFFLMVIPFLVWLFPLFDSNSYIKLFAPGTYVALIRAVACAYNFDMWNVVFIQIAFLSSIFILFIFSRSSIRKNEKYLFIFTILLIIITQVFFIRNGESFSRIWEVTEYKEFFITLAFFLYSLDVFIKIKGKYLKKSVTPVEVTRTIFE